MRCHLTILAEIYGDPISFSDPVRVLSIGRNPIQVLLIRSDPVRVLSIRSDPIRSRFCKRPAIRARVGEAIGGRYTLMCTYPALLSIAVVEIC